MNIITLANYIINLCNQKYKCGLANSKYKQPITHLYLNKLLYFLNIQYMLKSHKALIPNHSFYVWFYGATNPDVFDVYQKFGGSRITHIRKKLINMNVSKNGNIKAHLLKYRSNNIPSNIQKFIKQALPSLLAFSSFELVKYSHINPQWKQIHDEFKSNAFKHSLDNHKDYQYYKKPRHQFWNSHWII